MGIETIGQLATVGEEKLVKQFGKFGYYMHRAALGDSDDEVKGYWLRKSINRNSTFYEDSKDTDKIEALMKKLVDSVHRRLVDEGFKCKTVGIRVRFSDFETFTRAKTLEGFTDDLKHILNVALYLLRPFYRDNRKVRQIGVRVSGLTSDKKQRTVIEFIQ